MIKVKKNSRLSISIYLSEEDVKDFLEYLIDFNSAVYLKLTQDSVGFKSKNISTLQINRSNESYLIQDANNLLIELDTDDFEYLIFKLNDRLDEGDFIPSELFTIDCEKNKSIDFYLMKQT